MRTLGGGREVSVPLSSDSGRPGQQTDRTDRKGPKRSLFNGAALLCKRRLIGSLFMLNVVLNAAELNPFVPLISMGLKKLIEAMYSIIANPRASRIEMIEAAKVIAACSGVLLPDTSEALLSTRQAVELRAARAEIAEKMRRRKERKRLENRRGYLRRKLRNQDQQSDAHTVPLEQEHEGEASVTIG